MARSRRPSPSILETLALRSAERRDELLRDSYREVVAEVRELWPLSPDADPLAPRLTQRLAILESLSGRTPPAGVLRASAVLRIAKRRGLLL